MYLVLKEAVKPHKYHVQHDTETEKLALYPPHRSTLKRQNPTPPATEPGWDKCLPCGQKALGGRSCPARTPQPLTPAPCGHLRPHSPGPRRRLMAPPPFPPPPEKEKGRPRAGRQRCRGHTRTAGGSRASSVLRLRLPLTGCGERAVTPRRTQPRPPHGEPARRGDIGRTLGRTFLPAVGHGRCLPPQRAAHGPRRSAPAVPPAPLGQRRAAAPRRDLPPPEAPSRPEAAADAPPAGRGLRQARPRRTTAPACPAPAAGRREREGGGKEGQEEGRAGGRKGFPGTTRPGVRRCGGGAARGRGSPEAAEGEAGGARLWRSLSCGSREE